MIKEDDSITNLSKKELMRKVVTLETIQDLTFLNQAMQETLRFQNPAAANTPVYFTKEGGTLGKYKVDTTTEIAIIFHALHTNAKQWQRPHEFLPERFDKESPLYLTPDGKKRHPFAFAGFNGGKRVCFGKTFAEATIKIVVTYLTAYFNFEHVDVEYRDKNNYPLAHFGIGGKRPPVFMTLTPNDTFKD